MSLGTSNRDGGRTSEAAHHRIVSKIIEGDIADGLAVSQRASGVNMSVDVSIGDGLVRRSDGTYAHPVFNDAVYNQVIAAADGSNPRRDIIVIYVDYTVTPATSPSNNTNGVVKIKAVAGTPAGSPSDPNAAAIQASVGSGNPYSILARVRVAAGATSIANSVIDDLRTMATIKRQRTPNEAMFSIDKVYSFTSPDIFINGVDQNNASNSINYVPPAGLKFIEVEVVGGGGSGGGTSATGASTRANAAGGGGGGYSKKKILASSLGATELVTVGAGGASPTAGANNGNAGGTSSFGSHCSANGGAGGGGASASSGNNTVEGGLGGTATGGDMNMSGGDGSFGSINAGSSGSSGDGGASIKSGSAAAPVSENGRAGKPYGGGGSGQFIGLSVSAKTGGAGASGVVIIREYF